MSTSQNQGKRIIVACDGTWKDSDRGVERTSWLPWNSEVRLQLPSNVTRICRALKPEASDGTEQIIAYMAGLGSEGTFSSYVFGGYLAEGISENIREAYAFIAKNYKEGDEIFLLGFSRGAFTARSIVGLIQDLGLLTTKGMEDFYAVFKDWENQNDEDYVPYPAKWLSNDRERYNSNTKAAYVKTLQDLKLSRLNIPIKVVGVWDTVGSLGIPDNILWKTRKEYSFINTEIGPNVENAFQALALDESRTPFSPTMWEMPKERNMTLKQCWFPGAHSNVGGTYADSNTSDISLAWMVSQLAPLLEFDEEYVLRQQKENIQWYTSPAGEEEGERAWGMGKIWDSSSYFIGSHTRTPGTYCRTNPTTGDNTGVRLKNTKEFIHPCARTRMEMKGRGIDDANTAYVPNALSSKNGWSVYKPNQPFNGGKSKNPWPKEHDNFYKWVSVAAGGKDGPVYILEDTLSSLEKQMVKNSPDFQSTPQLQALEK